MKKEIKKLIKELNLNCSTKEFKDKVDWDNISKYQKLSKSFIKEFALVISDDNWLYKSTKFKKNKIVKSGKYKCHKNYFIAYKAVKFERHSVFNFHNGEHNEERNYIFYTDDYFVFRCKFC